jgi:antitoxin component YwqK of YwqJK toxin-antitoxin module
MNRLCYCLYLVVILLISCNSKDNNESKDKNVIINRTYYPNGKLKSEKSHFLFIKDGLSKEYYENGKLSSVVSYKDGLRNGIFILFSKIGTVQGAGFYKNDKRDSTWVSYYKNGTIKKIMYFEDDKQFKSRIDYYPDTKVIEQYTFYDFKGEPIYASTYDKNGKLIKEKGCLVPMRQADDYNITEHDTLKTKLYVTTPQHYKKPIVLSKMEPVSTGWETLQIINNCASYQKINTSNTICKWYTKVIMRNIETQKDSIIESNIELNIDG